MLARIAFVVGVALVLLFLTLSATSTRAAPASYSHVVVVIEENYDNASVLGGGQAPYLSVLSKMGVVFTGYHGVTHPSEGNYMALFTGSTQGTDGSDSCIKSTAPSVIGELVAVGYTAEGYIEGLTSGAG